MSKNVLREQRGRMIVDHHDCIIDKADMRTRSETLCDIITDVLHWFNAEGFADEVNVIDVATMAEIHFNEERDNES